MPKNAALLALALIFIIIILGFFKFRPSHQVTSFEECANLRDSTIQESYPETCITKDGQQFTRQLTDEETRQLTPTPTPSNASPSAQLNSILATTSATTNSKTGWKIYTNDTYKFKLEYPPDWLLETAQDTNQPLVNLTYGDELNSTGIIITPSDWPMNDTFSQLENSSPYEYGPWTGETAQVSQDGVDLQVITLNQSSPSGDQIRISWIQFTQSGDQPTPEQILHPLLNSFTFTQ